MVGGRRGAKRVPDMVRFSSLKSREARPPLRAPVGGIRGVGRQRVLYPGIVVGGFERGLLHFDKTWSGLAGIYSPTSQSSLIPEHLSSRCQQRAWWVVGEAQRHALHDIAPGGCLSWGGCDMRYARPSLLSFTSTSILLI